VLGGEGGVGGGLKENRFDSIQKKGPTTTGPPGNIEKKKNNNN